MTDSLLQAAMLVANQERRKEISRLTKKALAERKARGVQLGRPKVVVDLELLRKLRKQGFSWSQISTRTGIARSTVQRSLSPVNRYHGLTRKELISRILVLECTVKGATVNEYSSHEALRCEEMNVCTAWSQSGVLFATPPRQTHVFLSARWRPKTLLQTLAFLLECI